MATQQQDAEGQLAPAMHRAQLIGSLEVTVPGQRILLRLPEVPILQPSLGRALMAALQMVVTHLMADPRLLATLLERNTVQYHSCPLRFEVTLDVARWPERDRGTVSQLPPQIRDYR